MTIVTYQGDTLDLEKSFSGYDYSADTLIMHFVNIDTVHAVICTDSGNSWTCSPDTTNWESGTWKFQTVVTTAGGNRKTLETGSLNVKPSCLNSTTGLDTRTSAEKILENINAVLEGKATQDQKSYTIAGRSLNRFSWKELIEARNFYSHLVRREKGESRTVEVSF